MYGFSYEESDDETALNEQRYTFGEFRKFLEWLSAERGVSLARGWPEMYEVDLNKMYVDRRIPGKPNHFTTEEMSLEASFQEFREQK